MLNRILSAAKSDPEFKAELLASRSAADPADEMCKICAKYGFELSVGELFAEGEEYYDNLRKSVNGAATDPIDGWEDSYDLFFASLEG